MTTEDTNEYEVSGMTIQYTGSRDDGLTFQNVRCKKTGEYVWISDTYPGQHFKQVFVPYDFNHPSIIA